MLHKLATHRQSHSGMEFSERKRRIYDFLRQNPIAVLSSVSPDGDPHGAVIYYAIDKQFVVQFLTKSETRKYDNLKHKRHVMLTVFEPRSQTTAQISGEAIELTDSYEVNAVAAKVLRASLKTSDAGLPPLTKLDDGRYVAFRVEPVQIRMAVYDHPDGEDYNALFESIESFELKDAAD